MLKEKQKLIERALEPQPEVKNFLLVYILFKMVRPVKKFSPTQLMSCLT